jgi:hypothetical protein
MPRAVAPTTGDANAGKDYVMTQAEVDAFPRTDWDAVEADLKKEKR